VLDYLVSSPARRRVITALFKENVTGTARELAAYAHVGYATVHAELRELVDRGIVTATVRWPKPATFAVTAQHPLIAALRAIAASGESPPDGDRVRGELFSLGAPLYGAYAAVDDVEAAIVRGVAFSHHDATIGSILPVVLYKNRDRIVPKKLLTEARCQREKRSLGFYLDLTAKLSGDKRFSKWAKRLQDRRCVASTYLFLTDRRTEISKMLARQRAPRVARRWKLYMNMGEDAFQMAFRKHVSRQEGTYDATLHG